MYIQIVLWKKWNKHAPLLSKINGEKPPIGVRLVGIAHIAIGSLLVIFATITISSCIVGTLFLMGALVVTSIDMIQSLPLVGDVLGSPVGYVEIISSGTWVAFFVINAGIFILGLVYAETGNALFNGTEWARVATLIFVSITLLGGGIISIYFPYIILLVVLDLFLLGYFHKPQVKKYFEGSKTENSLEKFVARIKNEGIEDIGD